MKLKNFNLFSCAILGFVVSSSAQVNVLTYHFDNMRSGLNANETILNRNNVNSATFGKLFSYAVDGYVYAQPLYVSGVSILGQGTHNVLFVATEHNSVYAFDADSSGVGGGLLWYTNLGPSAPTPTTDFGNRSGPYNNIVPEVGITSTPVIDPVSGTLFVNAFVKTNGGYSYFIHALSITNGQEQPFSPVSIVASVPGTGVGSTNGILTFVPKQQIQRTALTLAGGVLYVAFAGFADTDPYHGWILGYDAGSLQLLTNYVFNTTPNSDTNTFGVNAGEGGFWTSGGGLSVDASTNIYAPTGNGSFNASNSLGTEFGDTFLKFSSTNGLTLSDYFTPSNQAALQTADKDIGSGGLCLLPDQPGPYPHLMIGGGKQGVIYLINRDQLTSDNGHYATNTVDKVVQIIPGTTGLYDTPAYFNGMIYWCPSGDKLKAFSITNGMLSSTAVSTGTRTFASPGATPCVSANGTNDGIVWAMANANPAILVAYNPTNLATELYNSTQAAGNRDRLANGVKFTRPIVANGKVYAAGQGSVAVFGLLTGTLAFSVPSYSVQEYASNATITVTRIGGTTGAVSIAYATVPGGSAINGVNYNDTSGILTWTNGESAAKNFTVTILNDLQPSTNYTVNLDLTAPSGSPLLGLTNATLTIVESPNGVWTLAHFGTKANDPSTAGDLADPDGDGVPNLLEYALATDPNSTNTNSSPAYTVSGTRFQLAFNRNTSAADITYAVEYSDDLQVWNSLMTYNAASGWVTNLAGATVAESAPTGPVPDQFVAAAITDATDLPTATDPRFFRLRVHR